MHIIRLCLSYFGYSRSKSFKLRYQFLYSNIFNLSYDRYNPCRRITCTIFNINSTPIIHRIHLRNTNLPTYFHEDDRQATFVRSNNHRLSVGKPRRGAGNSVHRRTVDFRSSLSNGGNGSSSSVASESPPGWLFLTSQPWTCCAAPAPTAPAAAAAAVIRSPIKGLI